MFSWILYLQPYITHEQRQFYFFCTSSYAPCLFSCLLGVPRPSGGAWRGHGEDRQIPLARSQGNARAQVPRVTTPTVRQRGSLLRRVLQMFPVLGGERMLPSLNPLERPSSRREEPHRPLGVWSVT